MPDELREVLQRLTALEVEMRLLKERLNKGISYWQFLLLLAVSAANAAAHWFHK
jgi:hypothetical protein